MVWVHVKQKIPASLTGCGHLRPKFEIGSGMTGGRTCVVVPCSCLTPPCLRLQPHDKFAVFYAKTTSKISRQERISFSWSKCVSFNLRDIHVMNFSRYRRLSQETLAGSVWASTDRLPPPRLRWKRCHCVIPALSTIHGPLYSCTQSRLKKGYCSPSP